jgi:hypothetical protein
VEQNLCNLDSSRSDYGARVKLTVWGIAPDPVQLLHKFMAPFRRRCDGFGLVGRLETVKNAGLAWFGFSSVFAL